MANYDDILDKLRKEASDRDVGTAKKKCPLAKKPAIYIAVFRGDTGEAVSGIKVDIGKPTKKAPSTNGSGEVKVDPAKKGTHGIKLVLTDQQAKEFSPPQPISLTTAKGKTSVGFFLIEPLPKLVVEVWEKDGNSPVNGVRVRAGRLPELTTSGGKADFGGVKAGKYRVTVTVDKPLETQVEVFHLGASLKIFEPGYTASWDVDLPHGDHKMFKVVLAKVRWVEFILAEQDTDKPIVGADLHAKLPGGARTKVTTNEVGSARVTYAQDGKVEIERIEMRGPGSVVKIETR